MADYFVAATGSNTAPHETWAKAATSLQTALTAATASGDRVILQHNGVPAGDAEVAADTTYTIAANISLITSTNTGTSTITPTAMGATTWVGNSTAFRFISIAGAFKFFVYGLTIRTAGATADDINLAVTDGAHAEYESCYFWNGNTAASATINIGASGTNCFTVLKNCTFRFAAVGQWIELISGDLLIDGGSVSALGSAPTILFGQGAAPNGNVWVTGCDLSHVTGTLIESHTTRARTFWFDRCRFGVGATVLATQTPANKGSAKAFISDCANGDTHSVFEYHDAFGSLTVSTGIYQNGAALFDGTNAYSWKIVTTANCGTWTPFVSPWIDAFNSNVATAITPYFEILRDGSATAYTDAEIWGEWAYKGTANVPTVTLVNDRVAVAGTAANQAASALGAADWTGEGATAWFGKLAPGAAFTPTELGDISARAVVGAASITVYVTPKILGLA